MVTVKIKRSDNCQESGSSFQEYAVHIEDKVTVLNLLKIIHVTIDQTIAYRNVKCYIGTCTACLMKINGKNLRACSVSVFPGDTVTIEPVDTHLNLRDLVVDFSCKYDQMLQ